MEAGGQIVDHLGLAFGRPRAEGAGLAALGHQPGQMAADMRPVLAGDRGNILPHLLQDRESVVEGKGVSVRVDSGGRRNIKNKKHSVILPDVSTILRYISIFGFYEVHFFY